MGQLVIAMLTAYVKNQGKNSIVGFTLNPTKVNCSLCYSSYLYLLIDFCL